MISMSEDALEVVADVEHHRRCAVVDRRLEPDVGHALRRNSEQAGEDRAATFSAPTTGRRAAVALPPLSAVQVASGASIVIRPSTSPRRRGGHELFGQLGAFRRGVGGLEALASRLHVFARAVRDLTHRRRRICRPPPAISS